MLVFRICAVCCLLLQERDQSEWAKKTEEMEERVKFLEAALEQQKSDALDVEQMLQKEKDDLETLVAQEREEVSVPP